MEVSRCINFHLSTLLTLSRNRVNLSPLVAPYASHPLNATENSQRIPPLKQLPHLLHRPTLLRHPSWQVIRHQQHNIIHLPAA
jgi:hypothetical protein